ncbi:DUF2160 domain-containing protein [Chitinimonas sp. DQS-5]|uniref:DUF2160 domain-containing protein n=2 Tax=Parachitinimonas caeni TaxID=3031301 RepID=A0ABT7E336_9NEIS|nr:DUF2160 domain-containing protein [Parachitinimonas caeni]
MAWTPTVAYFFSAVGVMLLGMTIWQIVSPSIPRRGFLPLVTTRGDRLFLGLLSAAYISLAWTGLTDMNQWYGTAIAFTVLLIVMRWG